MAYSIQSKSGRKALEPRRAPYWSRLSHGLHLGYRKFQQGEGIWSVRLRQEDGKRLHQTLGCQESYDVAAKEARKWAQKHEQGIDTSGTTVEGACRSYITYIGQHKGVDAQKDPLGRFKRLVYGTSLGKVKLDKLKPSQVRTWLNGQITTSEEEEDPESIRKAKDSANRNLNTLKAALNQALKDHLVDTDAGWRTVTRFPGVGKRRDVFLTTNERQSIIDSSHENLADLIRGMLFTLGRPGELAKAKVEDFDHKQGTLTLNGKNGIRVNPLSTAGLAFFEAKTRDKPPNAPLLPRADGAHWTKEYWRDKFRESTNKANLPDTVVLYSIRHSAISEAIANGLDTFVVAKLAGTSTAMIDKHYGHLRIDKTRDRLDDFMTI